MANRYVILPGALVPARGPADDAEYRLNYLGAETINAYYALANGYDGRGVRVAVIDDGVAPVAELAGQLSALSRDFGTIASTDAATGRTTERARNIIGDADSEHGTAVAGIIAARDDGVGVQGLAPRAQIVALRVDDVLADGTAEIAAKLDDAIDYAAANRIPIVNMSLSRIDRGLSDPTMQAAIARLRQAGGLLVNSAGNYGDPDPANAADLTDATADALLFVVALASTDREFRIADYSNRCGMARERCVAAAGSNATVAPNGDLIRFAGTSAAAPQVSALAAMILSKWPQLTGLDAGRVILATARDIGDPGVDAVYGHGLVDAQAALSPVSPTLSNGRLASAAAGSAMALGPAFGSGSAGRSAEAALASVTLVDAFGRDFAADASGAVLRAPAAGRARAGALAYRLEAAGHAGDAGFVRPGMAARIGYTRLRWGPDDGDRVTQVTDAVVAARFASGLEARATWRGADALVDEAFGLAPTSDVLLAYAPGAAAGLGLSRPLAGGRAGVTVAAGDTAGANATGVVAQWAGRQLSARLGLVDERGAVFGAPTGTGALRFGDGARTLFAELSGGVPLADWRLDGYASLGTTRLRLADDLLLTDAAPILTTRFGLVAGRALLGGRASVGVAQPLVAVRGQGVLTLGAGYDPAAGGLTFARRPVDFSGRLAPQLTLGYVRARGDSSVRLGVAGGGAPGGAGADLRVAAGWTLSLP